MNFSSKGERKGIAYSSNCALEEDWEGRGGGSTGSSWVISVILWDFLWWTVIICRDTMWWCREDNEGVISQEPRTPNPFYLHSNLGVW